MTPASEPMYPAWGRTTAPYHYKVQGPSPYFHVIRSSGENLDALNTFFNEHRPGAMVQPTLTVYRRAGRHRRPKPYQVLMYPGYAFVRPETLPDLQLLEHRWTHHFLRSATSHLPSIVPYDQVEYAMSLAKRSMNEAPHLPRGTIVRFTAPELHGTKAIVQECFDHCAIVWTKDADFPITCLLTDLETVSPPR